ncbi:hypothetical protein MTO96_034544, partial [Rhipicephalus appendiculatus]
SAEQLPVRDVPGLHEIDSLLMIEQRRPKKAILPILASAAIICLVLIIIISMIVSSHKRARFAATARTNAAIGPEGDTVVTTTSATTTSVTTASTAEPRSITSSLVQEADVLQTEPAGANSAASLVPT